MKKRQLKDMKYVIARIKISKIKQVFKEGSSTEYKEKLICARISQPTTTTSTCFSDNKTGRNNLLKFIRKELYL